jgi:hypothetical protein
MRIEAPCSKLQGISDCKEVYYFKIRSLTLQQVADAPKPLWRRRAAGNALAIAVQKSIWLFIILGLFLPYQPAYADECDDIVAEANSIFGSAKEAAQSKRTTSVPRSFMKRLRSITMR